MVYGFSHCFSPKYAPPPFPYISQVTYHVLIVIHIIKETTMILGKDFEKCFITKTVSLHINRVISVAELLTARAKFILLSLFD
jgi:hypothetical protein